MIETLLHVTTRLDQIGIEYVIGGSLASSAWGQQRATDDADLAAVISVDQVDRLARMLKWPYVFEPDALRQAVASGEEFACGQILNAETLDRIDLFVLPESEYSRLQLQRAIRVSVLGSKPLPVSAPEDTVIAKLRWFVLGNRVSDRQWNDIVQVLEVQMGTLDDGYLDVWAAHFNVLDLLIDARRQVVPAD